MSKQQNSGVAYGIRFGLAAIVYSVLMVTMLPLARSMPESPWRFVLVCLPVLGVLGGIWALWRLMREADEMQTKKLLEGVSFSVAATLVIAFCYGMCQLVGAPVISMYMVVPIWAVCFGIGMAWVSWKYR